MKIMIIGSSRSVNTFRYLYEVFKDQMPEEEVTLGIMYHSGCSMSMHVDFITRNEPACDYYLNNSGEWVITKGVTTDVGIADQPWDVIFLQAGKGDIANNMNAAGRKFLVDFVNNIVKTPHTFWWHSTWFNAEDPDHGFAPFPGQIKLFSPPGGPNVRIDSHVYSGYRIPAHYDSLTAKMIVWGENRKEAIACCKRALSEFIVDGIKTTIPFQQKVLDNKSFVDGNYNTGFVENMMQEPAKSAKKEE